MTTGRKSGECQKGLHLGEFSARALVRICWQGRSKKIRRRTQLDSHQLLFRGSLVRWLCPPFFGLLRFRVPDGKVVGTEFVRAIVSPLGIIASMAKRIRCGRSEHATPNKRKLPLVKEIDSLCVVQSFRQRCESHGVPSERSSHRVSQG